MFHALFLFLQFEFERDASRFFAEHGIFKMYLEEFAFTEVVESLGAFRISAFRQHNDLFNDLTFARPTSRLVVAAMIEPNYPCHD